VGILHPCRHHADQRHRLGEAEKLAIEKIKRHRGVLGSKIKFGRKTAPSDGGLREKEKKPWSTTK